MSHDDGPVAPVSASAFRAPRLLRWALLFVCIGGLGYLLWEPYGWWGEALTALITLLWSMEIYRGNQTEDYIREKYEDPVV